MFTESTHEVLWLIKDRILEGYDILEFLVPEYASTGVDRQSTTIFFAPSANGVITLEDKAQRVNLGVAAGAGLIGGMLLESLATPWSRQFVTLVLASG